MAVKGSLTQGNDGTATPAGFVGESISSISGAVTVDTGGYTQLASITLTVGEWEVYAVGQYYGGTITGGNFKLFAKGSNTNVEVVDLHRVSGSQFGCCSFLPRKVTIVSGDANKTIQIHAQGFTSGVSFYGGVYARRTA